MAERRQRHTWHYQPDQIVVAVHLPDDDSVSLEQVHTAVREVLEQQLAGSAGGVFSPTQSRQTPIVFRAEGRRPLAFLFYDLARSEPAYVKQVVRGAHAGSMAALESVQANGVTPLGVMPVWLGSTMQDFSDGSPATLPRPVRRGSAGPWRYRYTARDRGLDFRRRLARERGLAPVRVLILDATPDWRRARGQAKRFAPVNGQLAELLEYLGDTSLPVWHEQSLLALEGRRLKLSPRRDGGNPGLEVSDHPLFIAGLIHDLAPSSPIGILPVLNRYGVGDLHLLLQVLQHIVASKSPEEPVVINMALGFMPQLEYLPWLWYGVDRPNDRDFVGDVPVDGEARDQAWLLANRAEVGGSLTSLQGGLDQLGGYLLANNCFGVAAAGNDSLSRVEHGRPRFGPRYPASDEAVLGVAATTVNPTVAAEYSNLGDELEFGDHIATFGGGIRPAADTPYNGVIGLFTAPKYPRGPRDRATDLQNENGWAEWSGTSFATAITAGLVAGYWTLERGQRPDLPAAQVLAEFHRLARHYAPAVRTPSIAMRGEWERAV
jgi:hypothetical protein